MSTTYKWLTEELLPDGHRLFGALIEGQGMPRYAIADDSGKTPEDTDDGILWLDFDWRLIVSSPDMVLCIPVKRDNGERFSTITDVPTFLHLAFMFEWPIEEQTKGINYTITEEKE